MTTIPKRSSASRPTIQQNPVAVQEEYDDTTLQANDDEEYDDTPLTATPKSVLRHRPIQQPKAPSFSPAAVKLTPRNTDQLAPKQGDWWVTGWTRNLLWVALWGILLFLLLGFIEENFSNQWHYGDARVATLDCSSGHYIAQNINGKIQVIQEPGGDTSKGRIYTDSLNPSVFGATSAQITLAEEQDSTTIDILANNYIVARLVDENGAWKWERTQ